jgi:hypothetical protein
MMQSDDGSLLASSRDGGSTVASTPPVAEGFTLTGEDTQILQEYLDQFQNGNIEDRTRIVANAMAELAVLRPDGVLFDKVLASKVGSYIITQRVIQLLCSSENSQVVL